MVNFKCVLLFGPIRHEIESVFILPGYSKNPTYLEMTRLLGQK